MARRKPDNSRPVLASNLSTCADCGAPATSWRENTGGVAEGVCDEHRPALVERNSTRVAVN